MTETTLNSSKIASVYVFLNDMVMVFDERGEQMPDLQGPWQDKQQAILEKIKADGNQVEIICNAKWNNNGL